MKRILLLTLLLLCTTSMLASIPISQAHISTPGFYMGVQGGVSHAGYELTIAPGFVARKVKNTGFGTRVYGGFDITHYFGAEIGVAYFCKPNLININGAGSAQLKNNLVFLVGKGIWPLNPRLALYADLGIGYVVRSGVSINNTEVLSDKEIIRPIYGLGITYLIWTRWSADLTWLQAAEKNSDNLPFSNFIGIGIRYKFAS